MKKLVLVCSAFLAISGCSLFNVSGGSDGMEGGNAEVQQAIKDAEMAISKAAEIGGEWRDSKGKFIKKAKAAASKGDYTNAMKFAKRAKFEGEMAYQQAQEQKDAKPWLF